MMFEIVEMLGMFMNFPNKFQVNVAMLYFYNYFYISAMGFSPVPERFISVPLQCINIGVSNYYDHVTIKREISYIQVY